MEARAITKYVRLSPQKTRLVADQIRGLSVEKAINLLIFSNKKAGTLVKKTLDSAVANAEHNQGADIDELKIKEIFINEAPRMRRHKACAKGRAALIIKRSCHITIVVSDE